MFKETISPEAQSKADLENLISRGDVAYLKTPVPGVRCVGGGDVYCGRLLLHRVLPAHALGLLPPAARARAEETPGAQCALSSDHVCPKALAVSSCGVIFIFLGR